ncbi:hypothetical protein [Bradyrhizobium elkanii]
MRHDRGQKARIADRLVIVPAGNIGAYTLLPGLQDDNPHHTRRGALLLDDRMQLALHRVEHERHQAAGLRPDPQVRFREIFEIAVKPLEVVERRTDLLQCVHCAP